MKLAGAAVGALLVPVLAVGCSMPTQRRRDPMTPIEQLLTSEAIAKGLEDLALELPAAGAQIYLDTAGYTNDRIVMAEIVRGFLGRRGFDVEESLEKARYRIQLIVQALGTKQSIRFLGIPAASSSWLPISIPELALYKRNREDGYVRFYFDVFDAEGRYLRSSRDFEGSAYSTRYTVFLFFGWTRSDLPEPVRPDIDLSDSGGL